MGISWQIFIQTTCREPGVITLVEFLDGLPPKIWNDEKTFEIRRNFWQLRIWSRISPEWIHKSKIEKSSSSTTIHPTLGEKSWWTLVHKQKKWLTCILTHPSEHYSVNYISAFRGCCPLKFLHALEIDPDYLANTQTGTGSPPPKKKN